MVIVVDNVHRDGIGRDFGLITSSAFANFPTAGTAGRILRRTDGPRGLYIDNGTNWVALGGAVADAEEFGAKGDGEILTDAAISASAVRLTSASATFTSADVGKAINVVGAGAGGAALATTIASFVNTTSVDLTLAASTTVSGARCNYGTDDSTAINTALNTANPVRLNPRKTYAIASTLLKKNNGQFLFSEWGGTNGTPVSRLLWVGSDPTYGMLNIPQDNGGGLANLMFEAGGVAGTYIWTAGDASDGQNYEGAFAACSWNRLWFIRGTGKCLRFGDGAAQSDPNRNPSINGLKIRDVWMQNGASSQAIYVNEKGTDQLAFENLTSTTTGGNLARQLVILAGHVTIDGYLTSNGPLTQHAVFQTGGSVDIRRWNSEDRFPARFTPGTRPVTLRNIAFQSVELPDSGDRALSVNGSLNDALVTIDGLLVRATTAAVNAPHIEFSQCRAFITGLQWRKRMDGTTLDGSVLVNTNAKAYVVESTGESTKGMKVTVQDSQTFPSLRLIGPGGDIAFAVDSGAPRYPGVKTKSGSTNFTLQDGDHTLLCDASGGSIVYALPAAASHTGRDVVFKKIDASGGTITLDPNGSETIDGAATLVISAQNAGVRIQSNGTNWFVTGRFT